MTRSRTTTAAILIALAALIGITGCSSSTTPAAAPATTPSSSTTPTTHTQPAIGSCWELALDASVELDFYYNHSAGLATDPNSPLAAGTSAAIAKAPAKCDPLVAQYRATKDAIIHYHSGTTAAALAKWHAMADHIQM